MVRAVQYVRWVVRGAVRGVLSPVRRLAIGTGGVGTLALVLFCIVLFTVHGLRRQTLHPYDDDRDLNDGVSNHRKWPKVEIGHREIPQTGKIPGTTTTTAARTPRDPDPLTFKLIAKIYSHLSDAEQVSLAYELHVYPEKLLVRRDPKPLTFPAKREGNSSSESILCVKTPHANMRLGNLLFMYASTYALARSNDRILTADTEFDNLKTIFKDIRYIHKHVGNEIGAIMPQYHARYEALSLPDEDVCISGFLQSWRYFHAYDSELRDLLTFDQALASEVESQLALLTKPVADRQGVQVQDVPRVCVHVRRGDMVPGNRAGATEQGFRTPASRYYYKAMLYLYILHPHAHFYVISDDRAWCREEFADLHRVVTVTPDNADPADPARDLATLAACDHVIGSVGSFSWWGGWLAGAGKGTVVMYAHPLTPDSQLADGFDTDDYMPPQWRLIDDT